MEREVWEQAVKSAVEEEVKARVGNGREGREGKKGKGKGIGGHRGHRSSGFGEEKG